MVLPMINNFFKVVFRLYWLALLLGLSGCGQREGLAPVEELNWHAINSHARRHVVVRGETLYAVAFRYDQDYRQLAAANHLRRPYTLRVGQVLKVRTGRESVATLYSRPTTPIRATTSFRQKLQPLKVMPRQQYTGWAWPVRGKIAATYVPQQGKKGIDIAGHKGDRIRAAASGTVAYAGNGLAGYGNLIIIKHNNRFLTAYGNNLHNLVKEGQYITQGQVIADMGIIDRRYWGVHFEIRRAGIPVNPLNYLQK